MVVTFLRSHNAIKTKPNNVIYRNIKNINSDTFENDDKNILMNELHRFSDSFTPFSNQLLIDMPPLKIK